MTKLVDAHIFERMTEEMRPQDHQMDGSGLKFETLEHGGYFPDMFPNAIRVTDEDGRWCLFVPTQDKFGNIVRSHGWIMNPADCACDVISHALNNRAAASGLLASSTEARNRAIEEAARIADITWDAGKTKNILDGDKYSEGFMNAAELIAEHIRKRGEES